MNHNWSLHHHEVYGWHGPIQCDLQFYQCRHCLTIKQMPAQGEIRPPLAGCTVEKPIVVKIKDAIDPLEEKGDSDEIPSGKGKFRQHKTHGR